MKTLIGIPGDRYPEEDDYEEERELWEDNDVGVRKGDYDDEDDYMDAVRKRWPDNSVGIDKDDYDNKEDYLEDVREELEDRDIFDDENDFDDILAPKKYTSNRAWTDAEMELELLKIRREMQKEKEKKRETFDMIFPEFKNVPIIWLVIGAICFLFLLFTMII